MNEKEIKIGACIMVHNMAPLIGACVKSLQWVDGIFIFDDHSTDESIKTARKYSKIPIKFKKSSLDNLVFKEGELKNRNYILERAFKELKTDIMMIIDADEILSSLIKPKIIKSFRD